LAQSSFIAQGGERMQVIVRAPSPGAAIAAAQRYREWLLQESLWTTEATHVQVLDASTLP